MGPERVKMFLAKLGQVSKNLYWKSIASTKNFKYLIFQNNWIGSLRKDSLSRKKLDYKLRIE